MIRCNFLGIRCGDRWDTNMCNRTYMQYIALHCIVIQYNTTTQCHAMQCHAMQCNPEQYKTYIRVQNQSCNIFLLETPASWPHMSDLGISVISLPLLDLPNIAIDGKSPNVDVYSISPKETKPSAALQHSDPRFPCRLFDKFHSLFGYPAWY